MAHRYRSGFERDIAAQIRNKGIPLLYETDKVEYQKEPSNYKPDFKLPNGIYVETKGRFTSADRKKHLLVKEQHPELDIRFVFQNPRVKLSKASKTTYGEWATKHGFTWAEKWIPQDWFTEPSKT